MLDRADTRLVLNSYLFYEEIAQAVLAQEAEPTEGSAAAGSQSGGTANLYETIAHNRHKIVVTDRIVAEYLKEAVKYQGIPLAQVVDALRNSGLAVNPNRTVTPTLTGIPRQHRALVEEAIRTQTSYLITRYEVWHQRGQYLEESHDLKVLYPEQYTV